MNNAPCNTLGILHLVWVWVPHTRQKIEREKAERERKRKRERDKVRTPAGIKKINEFYLKLF